MNNIMLDCHENEVHIWNFTLSEFFSEKNTLFELLNSDEKERALRFHFEIHQLRFIVARALMRKILGSYCERNPQTICFEYGSHGKPSLKDNFLNLKFNLSHSDNMALLAVTQKNEVGIDLEKMEDKSHIALAKRFFNPLEFKALSASPESLHKENFYRLWTKKEAVIKTLGEGLFISLEDFSVSLDKVAEVVTVSQDNTEKQVHLHELDIADGEYKAAVGSTAAINRVTVKNTNSG